jgi:hypothetical protein
MWKRGWGGALDWSGQEKESYNRPFLCVLVNRGGTNVQDVNQPDDCGDVFVALQSALGVDDTLRQGSVAAFPHGPLISCDAFFVPSTLDYLWWIVNYT